MRRVLGTIVAVLAAAALVFVATGAGKAESGHTYWVELDNAFGLISGGDLKIAGVRAGKIGELKLDRKTHRALVEIKVTKDGFGDLRTDTTCQSRPQSLIGEYFVDCQPGTNPERLAGNATIPVANTSSTVAPDLVNDVLRRPYRERLTLIVNELGAAVAGNAGNLNDAIRRASPGLRETDKVLKILGDQNKVIADLVTNADQVIGDLSDNREDVARWVTEARDTAKASAERRGELAAGFRKLPGFLEELTPTMKALGDVTDEQTPALRTLQGAAGNLKTFFDQLGPFADASKPAFKTLGDASVAGRNAVRNAGETVRLLSSFSTGTPELAKNLAIILEHLDNRDFSVENDPRSPGGKGYTGLEALLQYVYDQVLSTNIYDQSVHILKVSPFVSDCGDYADVQRAKTQLEKCAATLGPRSPGINYPDTTKPDGVAEARARKMERKRHLPAEPQPPNPADPGTGAQPDGQPAPDQPQEDKKPSLDDVIPGAPAVPLPDLDDALPGAGDLTGSQDADQREADNNDKLLDFLLTP